MGYWAHLVVLLGIREELRCWHQLSYGLVYALHVRGVPGDAGH
jgi:hypothetical protein